MQLFGLWDRTTLIHHPLPQIVPYFRSSTDWGELALHVFENVFEYVKIRLLYEITSVGWTVSLIEVNESLFGYIYSF